MSVIVLRKQKKQSMNISRKQKKRMYNVTYKARKDCPCIKKTGRVRILKAPKNCHTCITKSRYVKTLINEFGFGIQLSLYD